MQAEERASEVAKLYLAGETVVQIATALDLCNNTVRKDIARARQRWSENFSDVALQIVNRELNTLDRLEDAAWCEFEKSKREEKEVKTRKNNAGEVVYTEVTIRQPIGNVSYLNTVLSIVERRCAIMGLNNKPKEAVLPHTQTPLTPEALKAEILHRLNQSKNHDCLATAVGEPPGFLVTEEKEIATEHDTTGTPEQSG